MKEFLERNKKVILISLIIFLVFAIGAAIFTFITIGDDYGLISETIYQMKSNGTIENNTPVKLPTIELYLHNLFSDFVVIAGGLLFSIISIGVVVFNAISIGMPFGADLTFFAPTILPHGIIEYLATVFSLACAFNITKLEIAMIKNRSFRNTLNEHKRELKDILIMIVIVVVLLAIAAIIECNFTDVFAYWLWDLILIM